MSVENVLCLYFQGPQPQCGRSHSRPGAVSEMARMDVWRKLASTRGQYQDTYRACSQSLQLLSKCKFVSARISDHLLVSPDPWPSGEPQRETKLTASTGKMSVNLRLPGGSLLTRLPTDKDITAKVPFRHMLVSKYSRQSMNGNLSAQGGRLHGRLPTPQPARKHMSTTPFPHNVSSERNQKKPSLSPSSRYFL